MRLVLTLLCLSCVACRLVTSHGAPQPEGPHLRKAEEYTRRGELHLAIQEYRAHIADREGDSRRPDWENPSFYLLLIGDLLLEQGKPLEALKTFAEAESAGVTQNLIADRYRSVARWYEMQGELEAALQVLERYRDRDELLYDVMRDRIAKELVEREEANQGQP